MIGIRGMLLLISISGLALYGCATQPRKAPYFSGSGASASPLSSNEELVLLYNDTEGWNHCLAKVREADPDTLQLAKKLYDGSDAGPANELELAFAAALSVSPVRILGLNFPADRLKVICGGLDDDDPECQTKGDCIHQLERRLKIVQRVSGVSLKEQKNMCLKEIREGIEELEVSKFF